MNCDHFSVYKHMSEDRWQCNMCFHEFVPKTTESNVPAEKEKCCDHFVKDGEQLVSNPPPCSCDCHKTPNGHIIPDEREENWMPCYVHNSFNCPVCKRDTPVDRRYATYEEHDVLRELFNAFKNRAAARRDEEKEWRRALLSVLEDYALSEASKKSHLSDDCDDLRHRFL